MRHDAEDLRPCDYPSVVKLAREYGFRFTNEYKSEILIRTITRGPLAGKTLAISDDEDTMSLPCDTDATPVSMGIYAPNPSEPENLLAKQEDYDTYPSLRAALVVASAMSGR